MITLKPVYRGIALSLLMFLALVYAFPAQDRPQPAAKPASADAAAEFKDLNSLITALPTATVKPLDNESALLFSALPLACTDDLQPRPTNRQYFWQPTYKTVDGYERSRSFYGCNDWQTAVSATWTMVTLLKRYPELTSGNLIREKLTEHLGRQNLDGEL